MKKNFRLNKWIVTVFIAAFFITILVSGITSILMKNAGLISAIIVVIIIIFIGIFFDTVGIAVAAGNKAPFHSMAACRVPSAKYSLFLLDHASKVSNFLNDVIGDIAGIISGSGSAVIVYQIVKLNESIFDKTLIGTIVAAFIACLTIGGKAIGKEIAMSKSKEILNIAGKIMYFFNEKIFGIFKGV